jgi:hypothetical protein
MGKDGERRGERERERERDAERERERQIVRKGGYVRGVNKSLLLSVSSHLSITKRERVEIAHQDTREDDGVILSLHQRPRESLFQAKLSS